MSDVFNTTREFRLGKIGRLEDEAKRHAANGNARAAAMKYVTARGGASNEGLVNFTRRACAGWFSQSVAMRSSSEGKPKFRTDKGEEYLPQRRKRATHDLQLG